MGILGNMKVLPFLSCVQTSLTYQDGYCRCEGSQLFHYLWEVCNAQTPFCSTQIKTAPSSKKGKKRAKNENCVVEKKLCYFCVFTSWTFFWGSVRIEKDAWERCARQKFFLTFCHQLRCAILEISSYKSLIFSESYFGAQHWCNRSCFLVIIDFFQCF